MSEQDRINAMISYFFLGPLFLLARAGTPLTNPYVREHAKRSSIIIVISILIVIAYFLVAPYLGFSFAGFDFQTILLTLIISGCIVALIRGAYQAYHGSSGELRTLGVSDDILRMGNISGVYAIESEEDKIRILASLLPWLGIYLSAKYQNPLMERARIIGSFFTCIIILSIILGGAEGFLSFLITAVYIGIFVFLGVYLFVYERFVLWDILQRIPSYRSIEAHIVACVRTGIEFFGVVFGKKRVRSYTLYLEEALALGGTREASPAYFMSPSIIALPVINLLSVPSFFIASYRAYRPLIIQGFIITILFILVIFSGSYMQSSLILLLLFPIVHTAVHAPSDIHTRAPVIGIWIYLLDSYRAMHSRLSDMKNTVQTAGFTYDVTPPTPETTSK